MKSLYVLIIAVVCFILNLFVYYISEDYRWFLSEIKWEKENNIILKDEYRIEEKEFKEDKIEINTEYEEEKNREINIEYDEEDKLLEEKLNNKMSFSNVLWEEKIDKDYLENNNTNSESVNDIKKVKVDNVSLWEDMFKMSDYDNKVLSLFKEFNLVKLDYHWNLMDVTWEYPDKYFEYYTMDLTLLFFPNKNYNNLKDIFDIESNWYNFMIKEVDNFWDESFYINLWDDYKDDYVRVIFSKNDRVFWFKVLKSKYLKIKNILKKL